MGDLEVILSEALILLNSQPAKAADSKPASIAKLGLERSLGSGVEKLPHGQPHATSASLNVENALVLFDNLHRVALENKNNKDISDKSAAPTSLGDPQYRRIIAGLLDVIVLQGIQPSLSAGLGLPYDRRVRVTTYNAVANRPAALKKDLPLLSKVIDCLCSISQDHTTGVSSLLRDRALSDVVCGAAELAYSPSHVNASNQKENDVTRAKFQLALQRLLDDTPTHQVLPVLTSLVQSQAPSWFSRPLFDYLSIVPLRVNGIRNLIDFVASSSPALSVQSYESSDQRSVLPLTTDVLNHVSKLLARPSTSVKEEEYFSAIAEQLNFLLDGNAGKDLAKAAAFIVGSGLLGRKSIGSPGAVAWKTFALPLLDTINPTSKSYRSNHGLTPVGSRDHSMLTSVPCVDDTPHSEGNSIVQEHALMVALQRLSTITLAVPNPGLTKRLLSPLFLSLWALHNHAAQRCPNTNWSSISWSLLETYISRCSTVKQLTDVALNLLHDGTPDFVFAPGSQGGIEIRCRPVTHDSAVDLVYMMESLDTRASTFVKLLKTSSVDDDTIALVLVALSKQCLLPRVQNQHQRLDEDSVSPVQGLVSTTLLSKMLEQFQDGLSKSFEHVLPLIEQVLDEHIGAKEAEERSKVDLKVPSYKGLGGIVQKANAKNANSAEEDDSDSAHLVSVALSLLNAFLTERSPNSLAAPYLASLKTRLSFLSQTSSTSKSVSTAATNLLSLISLLSSSSTTPPTANITSTNKILSHDRETHQSALTDLSSPHPAIRAEGLATLNTLISPTPSPLIDPQTTTHLLISLLRDSEEFVFLSAIRTLVLLAEQVPRSVLRTLLDAYADVEQARELDERLRIGEALGKCVEMLAGRASTCSTMMLVAEGLVGVAGRRGSRAKEAARRRWERRKADGEARSAWGGEVPLFEALMVEEEVERKREENEVLRRVVQGWEGTGEEEDVRIRASAFSILGKTVDATATLESEYERVSAIMDVSTSVLRFERDEVKAVLRRATVLCVISLVRAFAHTIESGTNTEALRGVAAHLEELHSALQYTHKTDEDELVRGHARVALEELETCRLNAALSSSTSANRLFPVVNGGKGKLAGLTIQLHAAGSAKNGLGEMLIEEVGD